MEADAIISKAEGSDVSGLYNAAWEYLRPLHGLLGFEGKENAVKSTAQIHGLAKRHVHFLAQLLKVSCNSLTVGVSETDGPSQRRADELFKTLKLALDSFDALRPCLVGSPHEIEVQRYWMVRRLMAWKRFTEAREECWRTLDSLRVNLFCKEEEEKEKDKDKENVGAASARKKEGKASARKREVPVSARKKNVTALARKKKETENDDKYGVNLYGQQAECADAGLVGLVLGLVTDLIICTGECKIKDAVEYRKALVLIDQLVPWQRVSDKNTIEKHRGMLFKGLHKCALFIATEPSYFDPKLAHTFCLLALTNCAASSVKEQFLKVTRGICRQLVFGGPELSFIVGDTCKVALSTIFKDAQWQTYGEHEIVDVVEFYCRHCETNSKLSKDAKQFLHAIANSGGQGSSFPFPGVLHIYAFGLGFKEIELSGLCNDGVVNIDCELSEIPEVHSCMETYDSLLLSNLVKTIQNIVEEVQQTYGESKCVKKVTYCSRNPIASKLSNDNHIRMGRSFISIFKALEFLWKVSGGYIQREWDSFLANSTTIRHSAWHSSLEQAFLLFPRVFVTAHSCNFAPLEEKEELRGGCQKVLLAAIAALRLSLMRLEYSQESFEIINTLISGGLVQGQELKWLIPCIYNVGVQMFNNKQYDLACNPLKLAYEASWKRISLVLSGSLDEHVESEGRSSSSESISELVCDACAKSIALVDVLQRSGSLTARDIIKDFLLQWSSADPSLSSSTSRCALVKLWVKMAYADYKEMDADEPSVEGVTLYKFLSDSSCFLPAETLGILLEEELLAYTKIDTEFSKLIQNTIITLLLEDIYVTKEFSLQRSRVLLEQCKAARLIGVEGLDRCMGCLSAAIMLLRNVLEENSSPHCKSYHMHCVCHQLAITYCVHAFCTQELNANSEVIHDDISSAMELWSSVFSSEWLDINEEQKEWLLDSSIPLLLNMSQLLALKGFICLQSEVLEMILHIFSALKQMGPEESCALLWREGRLNHPLCCIPFSENILSTLAVKVGIGVNSIKFWDNCVNDHLGSVLEFQQRLMYDMFIEAQADRDLGTNSLFMSVSTIELLKETALTLTSNDQKTIQSAFTASNLWYILSEKYRRKGQFAEALKYSKEALLLRRKQLQRSFKILDKKETQYANNHNVGHKKDPTKVESNSMEALGSVATNVWPCFCDSKKQKWEVGLSQWIVLGNYLESLMQVGVVYEMLGAANQAEYLFLEGLNISNAHDLLLGQAAFGSCIGEIYRKCHKWDIAEKNFENAMQVFCRSDMKHVCNLCKVTIEAMLEMRIGDFVRRCPKERKHVHLPKDFASAVDLYMSAKEKLDALPRTFEDDMFLDRKIHIAEYCSRTSPASVEVNSDCSFKLGSSSRKLRKKKMPLAIDSMSLEDEFNRDVNELCKEIKKSHLGESLTYNGNAMTNSGKVSQKGKKASRKVDLDERSMGIKDCLRCSESGHRGMQSHSKSTSCKEMQKCQTASFNASRNSSQELSHHKEFWDLSASKNDKTDSMQELIGFNFECHRRSLMSRLLLQIGKFHEASEEFLKAHKIILQNLSLLFFCSDGIPCLCSFVNSHHCQPKCPGRKIPVDMLLMERAALLYHISWFFLKQNIPASSWIQCCSFSENRRSFVIGWLHHAFFICSQMPALLRKVSILLAIVHMPVASGGLSFSEEHDGNLSASHWSAYFHQASLGTTLRQEHLAVLDEKLASCDSDTNKVLHHINSRDLIKRVQQVLRLTPDKLDDLESFVVDFFKSVPLPTIVCISLLDSRYAYILEEHPLINSSSAWIFITRFVSNGPPVVILLPIHYTFEGTRKDDVEGGNLCSPYTLVNIEAEKMEGSDLGSTSEVNKWTDGSSQMVVDLVAEEFGLLLEESRLSTSNAFPVATNEDKNRWWQWRMQLDNRLGILLGGIEDYWLGPWKCLLLGEPSEASAHDTLQVHMQDLKSMIDSTTLNTGKTECFPVDAGLLKALLGGVSSLTTSEILKGISSLIWRKTFKHEQSPSSAQITSLDWSPKQNGKIAMNDSFLSHSIYEGSECQKIIDKAAEELTSVFQRATLQKNGYCNMHDKETRKSSRKKKTQFKDEDSKECRSSESSSTWNVSNNLGNSNANVPREPVVLVLDANSQVLPWESLAVLRKQEVYRMPSVGSILAIMNCRGHQDLDDLFYQKDNKLSKGKNNKKQEISVGKNVTPVALEWPPKLPVVDPHNAFYLLNPSGDLARTQAAFEDWFKNQQGWEGKTAVIPTQEECLKALQKHDLFIYFGHGSGQQYISEGNIRKLDYCAAAFLMGCSSGRLSCRGDYEPVGVALSYLIAGCPAIIANLWDVTDGDIDRFSRVVLNSWLELDSSHCSDLEVLEEFQSLTISGNSSSRKVLRPSQNGKGDKDQSLELQQSLSEIALDKSTGIKSTRGLLRTGSCIGDGRSNCKLPYLIGASPVCYGVPTTIKHK